MTLRVTVPTSFIHERYLGRPSCPKCGELLMAPEYSQCLDRNDVRHVWLCDKCHYGFETLIRFSVASKKEQVRPSLRLVSREPAWPLIAKTA